MNKTYIIGMATFLSFVILPGCGTNKTISDIYIPPNNDAVASSDKQSSAVTSDATHNSTSSGTVTATNSFDATKYDIVDISEEEQRNANAMKMEAIREQAQGTGSHRLRHHHRETVCRTRCSLQVVQGSPLAGYDGVWEAVRRSHQIPLAHRA